MSFELAQSVFELAQHTAVLADSSSDSDGILWLLLLGPASGFVFYGAMMRRYRNHDKRFHYEHDSESEMASLQAYDHKVNKIVGTRSRRIQGDNSNDPLQRLGANTNVYRRQ